MNILALNIGSITAWAVYNKTNVKKIISGRLIFKKDPEETLEGPYRRFRKVLEDALYNHNHIDKIYYQKTSGKEKEICAFYAKIIEEFCVTNNIVCEKHKFNFDKDAPKQRKHVVVDEIEADAINMIYYLLENDSKKQVA